MGDGFCARAALDCTQTSIVLCDSAHHVQGRPACWCLATTCTDGTVPRRGADSTFAGMFRLPSSWRPLSDQDAKRAYLKITAWPAGRLFAG
jgi:hypothetical protein